MTNQGVADAPAASLAAVQRAELKPPLRDGGAAAALEESAEWADAACLSA